MTWKVRGLEVRRPPSLVGICDLIQGRTGGRRLPDNSRPRLRISAVTRPSRQSAAHGPSVPPRSVSRRRSLCSRTPDGRRRAGRRKSAASRCQIPPCDSRSGCQGWTEKKAVDTESGIFCSVRRDAKDGQRCRGGIWFTAHRGAADYCAGSGWGKALLQANIGSDE